MSRIDAFILPEQKAQESDEDESSDTPTGGLRTHRFKVMLSLLLAFIGTFSGVLPKSCAKLAWLYFCYPVNKSKVNYDLFPPIFLNISIR